MKLYELRVTCGGNFASSRVYFELLFRENTSGEAGVSWVLLKQALAVLPAKIHHFTFI
jgi:hypothetical protein